MSKYTTEVRFIVENYAGLTSSADFDRVDELIDKAYPKIFTSKVEFFDPEYKPFLLKKILKHYYTREIGFETVGLWKLYMNRTLEEIMPYYNQLYKSQQLKFDPLMDTNITKTVDEIGNTTGNKDVDTVGSSESEKHYGKKFERDQTRNYDKNAIGTSHADSNNTDTYSDTSTNNGTSNQSDAFSDTPQGSLSNIESMTYLTTGEIIKQSTNNSGNVDHNGSNTATSDKNDTNKETFNESLNENWTETYNENAHQHNTGNTDETYNEDKTNNLKDVTIGKSSGSSYSQFLQEYRDTFLNIDMMVIEEFESCFMGLY